jgi:hypothetical protein
MDWKVVNLGKYRGKGKTLPQIVFKDPDWFFWACQNNVFKNDGKLKAEAYEIFKKATRIKIRQSGGRRLVSEFFIIPLRANLRPCTSFLNLDLPHGIQPHIS